MTAVANARAPWPESSVIVQAKTKNSLWRSLATSSASAVPFLSRADRVAA